MAKELISVATRNEFRETLTGFVLREIEMIFSQANLSPDLTYQPPISGQRRILVEQYYKNIDFSNNSDVQQLILAYEECLLQLKQISRNQPDDYYRRISENRIFSLVERMERDGFRYENGRFISANPTRANIETSTLVNLTEASVLEHIEKAKLKIENHDYTGAITNSYTLLEVLLKGLLRQTNTPFNPNEGDIRDLYKLISEPLNLKPKGESLESHLNTILNGLKKQVSGLYDIANKASDRHDRKYTPKKHHAKLAVNATFCLCEFLLESYHYQQDLANTKHSSQLIKS